MSKVPVTVASAERSFSKLKKRIKKYLRSACLRSLLNRLSGRAILSIENISQLSHFRSTVQNQAAVKMSFYTRCLQDLPQVNINDVHRLIQENSKASSSKREKGFKLYISSYIHDCEGCPQTH
ncbi:unnamed protein product [Leuciscus chuanchicus]